MVQLYMAHCICCVPIYVVDSSGPANECSRCTPRREEIAVSLRNVTKAGFCVDSTSQEHILRNETLAIFEDAFPQNQTFLKNPVLGNQSFELVKLRGRFKRDLNDSGRLILKAAARN